MNIDDNDVLSTHLLGTQKFFHSAHLLRVDHIPNPKRRSPGSFRPNVRLHRAQISEGRHLKKRENALTACDIEGKGGNSFVLLGQSDAPVLLTSPLPDNDVWKG